MADFVYRVRHKKIGWHYHCSLFVRTTSGSTWAKCGDFVVRWEEFPQLKAAMAGVEFLDESTPVPVHTVGDSDAP